MGRTPSSLLDSCETPPVHELSVTQSLLEIATRHAGQAGAARVTDLHLVIGQLSSIVDDSVQFYWEILSKGTIAEGALLHFRREPATAACLDCGRTWNVTLPIMPKCPHCGSARMRVTGGREFFVESIEVEG